MQTITEPENIQNCTCYNNESCDSGAWSYWSNCDGKCKQTRIRNQGETDEATESRDCQNLCFLDVEDDIDEELKEGFILDGLTSIPISIMFNFQHSKMELLQDLFNRQQSI